MREFDKAMSRAAKKLQLKPGDIYESCSYHPVLCLGVDYKSDEVWGISLIDGTYPLSCSLVLCGIRKLTPKLAWQIRMCGPIESDARDQIAKSKRWWNAKTEAAAKTLPVRLVGPRILKMPNPAFEKGRAKDGAPHN